MSQFQLVMRSGPAPGKVFPLAKDEMLVGRDVSNEIVINDAEVSRRHCRFSAQEDHFIIEDLESKNGTYVNGQRISSPTMLSPGTTIRLGDNVVFSFELVGVDTDATVAASGRGAAVPPVPAAQPAPREYAGKTPSGPPVAEPAKKGSSRGLLIGCAVVLVVGACVAVAAGLWYIDANLLWCDVFGTLLPGCPPG